MAETVPGHAGEAIDRLLAPFPRVSLAVLPTPLEPLPRLSAALGGPRLFVKRDDLTGLAFGGNKTRQLEFLFGALERDRPDMVVTGANIQSNWCRQAAAAAARLGIPIVLVLRTSDSTEIQGNALLDLWLGADIRFVDEPDMTRMLRFHIDRVVDELRDAGRDARKLDPWDPRVPLSYVAMMAELRDQCDATGLQPSRLWLAAAGPTLSGMELGARLLEWEVRITGVAPITWSDAPLPDLVAGGFERAAALIGSDLRLRPAQLDIREDYIGPGYGRPSPEGLAAMLLAARTDGLLLDPVYTGKAMAGLIDAIGRDELTDADSVVFLHTGGLPAAFAHRDAIVAACRRADAPPA